MLELDWQEASNKTIEYIEYLAAFSNPEGVKEVRKNRESASERPDEDPELFAKVLSEHLGKKITKEEILNGE
jgi:hypothetical protein